MLIQYHPRERKTEEYVLFALTFVGLGIAAGGIILCLPALGLTGVAVTLVALLGFAVCAALSD